MADPRRAASRRAAATRFRVIRTDTPRAAARRQGPPRARPQALDLERPVGRQAGARRASTSSRCGCATARATSAATPARVPFDAGDSPGPGRDHRALARRPAAAAAGHRGREGGLLRRLARAPVPLGDPPRRRQAARAPRQGRRGREGPADGCARRAARAGLYLVELQSGPQPHRGAVPRAGARARDDARRRARRSPGSARTRSTTRRCATACPTRSTARAAAACAGRACSRARTAGRPGFSGQVAPLLRYLDRNRIRYDLTSDLDLALSDSPRASDRKAVLLAGSMRWVTRPLARRLRRYVQDGGRLATFGARDAAPRRHAARRTTPRPAASCCGPTQPSAGGPVRRRGSTPCAARTPRSRSPSSAATRPTGCSRARAARSTASARSRSPRRRRRAARRRVLGAMGVAPPEPDPDAPADEPPPEPRYALTAIRLGEKGLVIRVGPAAVDAAAARSRRSRRSRATSSTCCAARSRRSARCASGTSARSEPSRPLSTPSPSIRSHSGAVALARGRRRARRRSAARRARRPPRAGRRRPSAAVPELRLGVLGQQRAGERVLGGVEDDDRARVAGQRHPPRLPGGDPLAHQRRAAATVAP